MQPATHDAPAAAPGRGLDARDGERELWRVVGASEAGAGHLRSSKPCQDANACVRLDGDWLAVAVADGAGSAAQAEVGAALAVEAAVQTLVRAWPSQEPAGAADGRALDAAGMQCLLRCALARARVAVEAEALVRGIAPRELACTLIVALLGPGLVAAAGVGDGGAVVELPGGRLETLLRPDSGEYVNETTFLTGAGAVDGARFATIAEPVESLALITDGLQALALHRPEWTPFERFFAPVFGFLRAQSDPAVATDEVRRMLRSEGVRSRTDDDVTLLVATRAGGGGEPQPEG